MKAAVAKLQCMDLCRTGSTRPKSNRKSVVEVRKSIGRALFFPRFIGEIDRAPACTLVHRSAGYPKWRASCSLWHLGPVQQHCVRASPVQNSLEETGGIFIFWSFCKTFSQMYPWKTIPRNRPFARPQQI